MVVAIKHLQFFPLKYAASGLTWIPANLTLSHCAKEPPRIFFCAPYFQALGEILPMKQIELIDGQGQTLRIDLGQPQADEEEPRPRDAETPPREEPAN